MADDHTTEPTGDTTESRRPKLTEWSRDATDTEEDVAGWTLVGGSPPDVIERLKARAADEPEAPGEGLGPDDGPVGSRRGGEAAGS
jgi:hypothetical protein